jgi:hypothetical protein
MVRYIGVVLCMQQDAIKSYMSVTWSGRVPEGHISLYHSPLSLYITLEYTKYSMTIYNNYI